jgi:hypothetical protein|tara:strand:- start:50 stop:340 length:291 start_codon:yes stop_codon:yes gene_type:complete
MMKFWEKLKESDLGEKAAKKHPWWLYIIFFFGLIIGATAVALVVGAVYLTVGFFFSLLWNFAVAPIFGISELTTYTAAALLFLFTTVLRIFKWGLE